MGACRSASKAAGGVTVEMSAGDREAQRRPPRVSVWGALLLPPSPAGKSDRPSGPRPCDTAHGARRRRRSDRTRQPSQPRPRPSRFPQTHRVASEGAPPAVRRDPSTPPKRTASPAGARTAMPEGTRPAPGVPARRARGRSLPGPRSGSAASLRTRTTRLHPQVIHSPRARNSWAANPAESTRRSCPEPVPPREPICLRPEGLRHERGVVVLRSTRGVAPRQPPSHLFGCRCATS